MEDGFKFRVSSMGGILRCASSKRRRITIVRISGRGIGFTRMEGTMHLFLRWILTVGRWMEAGGLVSLGVQKDWPLDSTGR